MSIMIIFEVNHDYFCRCLCLCDVYFSLDSSGTHIPMRKQTVKGRKKVKRIKMCLSGGVCFDKNLSDDDS